MEQSVENFSYVLLFWQVFLFALIIGIVYFIFKLYIGIMRSLD